MTPSLSDLLRGNFMCLATPPDPEAAGDYAAGRVMVVALLNLLAAQELEKAGALDAENAEIAELIGESGEADTPDARNAALRRALVAWHEAAEARGDREADRAALALYGRMAERWSLDLPPLPGPG